MVNHTVSVELISQNVHDVSMNCFCIFCQSYLITKYEADIVIIGCRINEESSLEVNSTEFVITHSQARIRVESLHDLGAFVVDYLKNQIPMKMKKKIIASYHVLTHLPSLCILIATGQIKSAIIPRLIPSGLHVDTHPVRIVLAVALRVEYHSLIGTEICGINPSVIWTDIVIVSHSIAIEVSFARVSHSCSPVAATTEGVNRNAQFSLNWVILHRSIFRWNQEGDRYLLT